MKYDDDFFGELVVVVVVERPLCAPGIFSRSNAIFRPFVVAPGEGSLWRGDRAALWK